MSDENHRRRCLGTSHKQNAGLIAYVLNFVAAKLSNTVDLAHIFLYGWLQYSGHPGVTETC